MKRTLQLLMVFFCFFITVASSYGQREAESLSRETNSTFILKGSILDIETMRPVSKVNIEVTGGSYATTGKDGEFRISARVGDELVIRSTAFETVYYTVKDEQRLTIEVRPVEGSAIEDVALSFEDFMERARAIYKKDAAKGIDMVAQALSIEGISVLQRAQSYKVLGDIYFFWKQYDLAVTNYTSSLKSAPSVEVEISLAQAYLKNSSYQESIDLFTMLSRKRLNTSQKIIVQEALGDAYAATGDYDNSISNYAQVKKKVRGLNQTAEVARLNTKIGDAYEQQGAPKQAAEYFDEAIELSDLESSETSVRTKTKVADFYNRRGSYAEEIELRKSALEALKTVEFDSIRNKDAITPQKQNYKIGFAYAAQNRLDEAIPFLEKSVKEARKKEDLAVERDGRRRLSEVYRDKGDFTKAAENYEEYKKVVDLSYSRKEQEITQASRFVKDIAEKQNRILSLEKDRALNMSRYQLAFQEQELVAERDTRQRIIIGSLALVTALLLLTAFVMYRSSKQQKYANNLLALKSLRSQMNPHFIFNALNSVNSFIATNDERTANRYLSDFSILMRSVLENSEEDFIPLSKEVELIRKYVMLEHFRFKDKFDYDITIDDTLDQEGFMIPPMLLQPYVENAVWHGMRYKEEKGKLHIHFGRKNDNTAVVVVTDDGVGRTQSKALKTENQKKQKSQGMSNIKKRIAILNEMYGDRIDVAINDVTADGAGTEVILTLKKA